MLSSSPFFWRLTDKITPGASRLLLDRPEPVVISIMVVLFPSFKIGSRSIKKGGLNFAPKAKHAAPPPTITSFVPVKVAECLTNNTSLNAGMRLIFLLTICSTSNRMRSVPCLAIGHPPKTINHLPTVVIECENRGAERSPDNFTSVHIFVLRQRI